MTTATQNKQRVFNLLCTTLKKQYQPEGVPERPVLEQFVFAILRAGATTEAADSAFRCLQDKFFDWNEIRVSGPAEVAEALEGLPAAGAKAERVVDLLQEVFEQNYSFDLEALGKKGLKQAAKQLSRYGASDDFAVAWVVQTTLGGHAVPVDEPMLRCLKRLGLVDGDAHNLEAIRGSLEHQVPKAKAPMFCEVVSIVANEVCLDVPRCPDCPLKDDCPSARMPAADAKKSPKPR